MPSYLLAIVPPEDIRTAVDVYRKKYADHTGYKIPPHITLYPPFSLHDISLKDLQHLLKRTLKNRGALTLVFDSIDYFQKKDTNVVYFAPNKESKKLLRDIFRTLSQSLQNNVQKIYGAYPETPSDYNPHITITECVPDEDLPFIRRELSTTREHFSFSASSLYLYTQKPESKIWEKLLEINFGETAQTTRYPRTHSR